MTDTIEDTLKDRGAKYGDFTDHARISQDLKQVMMATPGWQRLTSDKREALEMVQHKIARILNGNPEYADNWHDICGYSKLAEDRVTPA
jgi:hypothetical protein